MWRVLWRARVEARFTWLFQQSSRSVAGKDDLKVVVWRFMHQHTYKRTSERDLRAAPKRSRVAGLADKSEFFEIELNGTCDAPMMMP